MTRKTRKKIEVKKHTLRNLASSLILYEKVKTTEKRAKSVRPTVERLITKSKQDTLANRRFIFAYLPQKEAAKKVVEELAKRYKDRSGGYTRITKLGQRKGDAANIAEISLVS